MAQWYCAGLENRFPRGFPGSIPGLGVFSGIEVSRASSAATVATGIFDSWCIRSGIPGLGVSLFVSFDTEEQTVAVKNLLWIFDAEKLFEFLMAIKNQGFLRLRNSLSF